jgi:hypothetical protein
MPSDAYTSCHEQYTRVKQHIVFIARRAMHPVEKLFSGKIDFFSYFQFPRKADEIDLSRRKFKQLFKAKKFFSPLTNRWRGHFVFCLFVCYTTLTLTITWKFTYSFQRSWVHVP